MLNPSHKFMVYLTKDDRVVINDCVYKNIQAPCKLFGQHNDELIVIDANNVLWNLSEDKKSSLYEHINNTSTLRNSFILPGLLTRIHLFISLTNPFF